MQSIQSRITYSLILIIYYVKDIYSYEDKIYQIYITSK